MLFIIIFKDRIFFSLEDSKNSIKKFIYSISQLNSIFKIMRNETMKTRKEKQLKLKN